VRHVGRGEPDPGLLQAQQEMSVAAQPVELRDEQNAVREAGVFERLRQLGPVDALAALDFCVARQELPARAPRRNEGLRRRLLRLEPEPAPALLFRRDPVVGDEDVAHSGQALALPFKIMQTFLRLV
jgi:hypothetical protein